MFPFVVSINCSGPAISYTRQKFLPVSDQRKHPTQPCDDDNWHLCYCWTPGHPCYDRRIRKVRELQPLEDVLNCQPFCGDWDEGDMELIEELCRQYLPGDLEEGEDIVVDLGELPSAPDDFRYASCTLVLCAVLVYDSMCFLSQCVDSRGGRRS